MDRACQQTPVGTLDCIAVSFSQELETRAWAATNGLGLKIALVRDPDFTKRYVDWLMAVPLVFLIDEGETIKYKRAGERSEEYDVKLVRDFVESGLGVRDSGFGTKLNP